MEAMPKNKYEDEKTKLPNWISSLRMVAGAFMANPKKTTKIDKQLEDLNKQTNTDLEITLFSDNNSNAGKRARTAKRDDSLSDRLKVKQAKVNSKQGTMPKETEINKDEEILK